MRDEATRILRCFYDQAFHVGDFIHFTEFGDAIVWEGGFVRDEAVRDALSFLIDNEYVVEMDAGLELTAKGESAVYGESSTPKHSARVYLVGGSLLVKQATLRGTPAEYMVNDEHVRRIGVDDQMGLARAILDAVHGRL